MAVSAIFKDIRAAFGDVEATPYTVVVQRGGYEERMYPARRWACTRMSGPSRHALVTPMFRRLFCYISGRNEPNVRIDMTTPVTTLIEPSSHHHHRHTQQEPNVDNGREDRQNDNHDNKNGEQERGEEQNTNLRTPNGTSSTSSSTSTTSSSTLPTYTMGFLIPSSHQHLPPASSDKNIFIEDRPKMIVLVRRFSGYMNDEVVRRELIALHAAIKNNGEEGVDFSKYYAVGYDPPFKVLGRRNEIWVIKKIISKEEENEEKQNGEGGEESDYVMVSNGANGEVEFVRENGNDEVVMSSS